MSISNDKKLQIYHKAISAEKQNWAVNYNDFVSSKKFIDCANFYVMVGGIIISSRLNTLL